MNPNSFSTYTAKPGAVESAWYVVDAENLVVGRLAARIGPLIANELLTLMRSDVQRVKRILCLSNYSNDKTKSYFNVPILQYVNVDQFISTLISIPDESRWVVCYALKERYRLTNHGLNDELTWITSFKDKLAQEVDSRRKTILGYCLTRINTDLDELIKCPIKETAEAGR